MIDKKVLDTVTGAEIPVSDAQKVSDGYHTFEELYDHRITLWIALCKAYGEFTENTQPWRSKLHSDNTMFAGWFVLGLNILPGHQITYHIPISRWSETYFARERERAPEFDGHTSANVLERIKNL